MGWWWVSSRPVTACFTMSGHPYTCKEKPYMQPRHTFYDDNALLDLRFLTTTKAYDLDDDNKLQFLPYRYRM